MQEISQKPVDVASLRGAINIPVRPRNENAFWQGSLAANELEELILCTANDLGNLLASGAKIM